MKSYILWDNDGVLVHTEPWYFEATRRCIKPLGVELTEQNYLNDMPIGRTAWDRARQLGVSEADITKQRDQRDILYRGFLRTEPIEIEGVDSVLATLALDYAMAIVTTAKKRDFELIHRHRNLTTHMHFVLVNGDYTNAKPAPDPYLAALERFNATPAQAIAVEDSERGLRSAVAAGIDCVVVANDFIRGQNLSAAKYQIDSLAELPQLLKQLNDA